MCRNIREGGRRCGCDNPTGRRQRRALTRMDALVTQYTLDSSALNTEHQTTSYSGNLQTVEEVKELVERLNAKDLQADELETLACQIGSGVSRIAETVHDAPDDDTFNSLKEKYTVVQEVAKDVERNMTHVARLASQINQDFGLRLSMNYKSLRGKALDKIPDETRKQELKELIEQTRLSVNQFLRSDEINYQAEFKTLIQRRADGYRKALQDIGVEFASKEDLRFTPDSDERVAEAARKVMHYMPASWWKDEDEDEPAFDAVLHPAPNFRPHYAHQNPRTVQEYSDASKPASEGWKMFMKNEKVWDGEDWKTKPVRRWKRTHTVESNQGTIEVGENSLEDSKIMIHELTHRAERLVPELYTAQEGFKSRRTKGQKVEPIDGNENEPGYRDNFVHHYMGRVYDHPNHEILSTGLEGIFYGAHSGLTHEYGKTTQPDPDHRSFVLGVMTLRGK